MEFKQISACYYPTTVVLVDDDPRFLQTLGLKLSRTLPYKLFDHPGLALKFFNEQYFSDPFINRSISQLHEVLHGHRDLEINIDAISSEVFNLHRFDQVSVLLVDYAMPNMDGLMLCRNINDTNIRKVLLTGEADEKIAVDAFNKGLIHRYIRKDTPQLAETVLKMIGELQQQYFLHFSPLIFSGLTQASSSMPATCLEDPIFFDLLLRLISENNIVEYYLIDASGSYLLLDAKAKPSILAVKSEEEMQTYTEFAEDDDTPMNLVKDYHERKSIPLFITQEDRIVSAKEWEILSYPAQKLQGKDTYYYSYIPAEDLHRYDVYWNKVLAYKDFLANLQ